MAVSILALLCAWAFAAIVFGSELATLSRACPYSDLCFALNIPETTETSGKGDIFFQIEASSSYEWVALGQGTQMAGANIFVVYLSADGKNVTVSPRLGTGHTEPQYNPNSNVTVLQGSGLNTTSQMFQANIQCGNCHRWQGGSMDFSSLTADWIYAVKTGKPLMSDDRSETISQHQYSNWFSWPLKHAVGGDQANPFLPGNFAYDHTALYPTTKSWVQSHISELHGIMAAAVFVVLFPFGGILIRLSNSHGGLVLHIAIQLLAWTAFLAAASMGVYMIAGLRLAAITNPHPILGIIILAGLLGQPIFGYMHHRTFMREGRRTEWSLIHSNIGRSAIILGIVNGGLGIQLAGQISSTDLYVYIAVAALVVIAYAAAVIYGERRLRKPRYTRPFDGDKETLLLHDAAIRERGRGIIVEPRMSRFQGREDYKGVFNGEMSRGPSPSPLRYSDRPIPGIE